jgi:hypothetical protein
MVSRANRGAAGDQGSSRFPFRQREPIFGAPFETSTCLISGIYVSEKSVRDK